MKVTDLMVGDWVYMGNPVTDELVPTKVANIYGEEINCKTGHTNDDVPTILSGKWLRYAQPIPLTEDILVKNGFERCDYNNQYFIINDAINLITPKWRGGTEYYACAWYQDEFDDLVQHIEICKCAYAHQLQHLLRLCGIEKSIIV